MRIFLNFLSSILNYENALKRMVSYGSTFTCLLQMIGWDNRLLWWLLSREFTYFLFFDWRMMMITCLDWAKKMQKLRLNLLYKLSIKRYACKYKLSCQRNNTITPKKLYGRACLAVWLALGSTCSGTWSWGGTWTGPGKSEWIKYSEEVHVRLSWYSPILGYIFWPARKSRDQVG